MNIYHSRSDFTRVVSGSLAVVVRHVGALGAVQECHKNAPAEYDEEHGHQTNEGVIVDTWFEFRIFMVGGSFLYPSIQYETHAAAAEDRGYLLKLIEERTGL